MCRKDLTTINMVHRRVSLFNLSLRFIKRSDMCSMMSGHNISLSIKKKARVILTVKFCNRRSILGALLRLMHLIKTMLRGVSLARSKM